MDTSNSYQALVNAISVSHFQLEFPNFRRLIIFHQYLRNFFQLLWWHKHSSLKMKSHRSISSSEYLPITAVSFWIFWKWIIGKGLRLIETHFPKKVSQDQYLKIEFILEIFFFFKVCVLTNLKFCSTITNLRRASESLSNTALVQLLYIFAEYLKFLELFAKVLLSTEFVFMSFFFNDSSAASKHITPYNIGKFIWTPFD